MKVAKLIVINKYLRCPMGVSTLDLYVLFYKLKFLMMNTGYDIALGLSVCPAYMEKYGYEADPSAVFKCSKNTEFYGTGDKASELNNDES